MAADGFTIAQYIELLRVWHVEITKKEKLLMNGFRVYQTLFFIQTACLNTFNIISTFITSIMIGLATNGDSMTLIILSSVATGLGVLIGIFNAINFVFKPQSTAVGAASSSKQYGGLAKELIIEIKSYEVMFSGMTQDEVSKFSTPNVGVKHASTTALDYALHVDALHINGNTLVDDIDFDTINNKRYIDFETYKNRLLYYSTREQLINIVEPGLLLIGYTGNKTVFDRTYVSSLPPKDLEFMTTYVDGLANSREKRKLKKILTRIYISSGTLEKN